MDVAGGDGGRKRAARVPAYLAVQYASRKLRLDSSSYDLSTSGIFIPTEDCDAPGTEAEVTLHSYVSFEPIRLGCRVARTGDQPTLGMGLEFVETDQRARDLLSLHHRQFDGSPRILMIDDDASLLRMMSRFVTREGFGFAGVNVPVTAERALARFQPHLVILDVMMPEVDGGTVAQRLLADPDTAAVPIMFYSASDPSALPADVRHLPFVNKGCTYDLLMREMVTHLPSANHESV